MLDTDARRLRSGQGSAMAIGAGNQSWSDNRSRAEAFLRRHRWRFAVLEDSDGRAGERYGVVGLPSTFIVDGSGHIVRQLAGPQTSAGLLEQVRSVSAAARGASPSG